MFFFLTIIYQNHKKKTPKNINLMLLQGKKNNLNTIIMPHKD